MQLPPVHCQFIRWPSSDSWFPSYCAPPWSLAARKQENSMRPCPEPRSAPRASKPRLRRRRQHLAPLRQPSRLPLPRSLHPSTARRRRRHRRRTSTSQGHRGACTQLTRTSTEPAWVPGAGSSSCSWSHSGCWASSVFGEWSKFITFRGHRGQLIKSSTRIRRHFRDPHRVCRNQRTFITFWTWLQLLLLLLLLSILPLLFASPMCTFFT